METTPKNKSGSPWSGKDSAPRLPSEFVGLSDLASRACSQTFFDRLRHNAAGHHAAPHPNSAASRAAGAVLPSGARPRPSTVLSSKHADAPLHVPDDLPLDFPRSAKVRERERGRRIRKG